MSRLAIQGILLVLALVILGAGVGFNRWLTNTTTVSSVIKPKPGVECVVVTSQESVATDCNWGK